MTTTTGAFDASSDLAGQLNELISGYQRTELVVVAEQPGLAELLVVARGRWLRWPRPQGATVMCCSDSWCLAGRGLFAERDDGLIELTPLAALLESGTPGSL